MAFPVAIKDEVYSRAAGQCECLEEHLEFGHPPHPGGRCPDKQAQASFYFVDKTTGATGTDSGNAADCIMICSGCHEKFRPQ
jgi:hypothetical protein